MERRRIGNSSLEVSTVGLGTNNFGLLIDREAARSVIDAAFEVGINFLDTADIYGGGKSEEFIGEILGTRRQTTVISTKVGITGRTTPPDASRASVLKGVEDSLRRLRTDYIDLYQIHAFDPATPLEETLLALNDLIRQGKVQYIGCSQFAAWQLVDANWTARSAGLQPFVSCMAELSLIVRKAEKELLPAASAHGVGFLPFFPLASGLLTGKYRQGSSPPDGSRLSIADFAQFHLTHDNLALTERLAAFAKDRGRTLLELAFAWLLSKPIVSSVIAGATKPDQVKANAAAASWRLTPNDCDMLEAVIGSHHAAGFEGFTSENAASSG